MTEINAAAVCTAHDAAASSGSGSVRAGVAGFRRAHEHAQAARRVAVASGETAPAISFGDEGVAITSLPAHDLESTSAWMAEVLGGLAADNENMKALGETPPVFLLTGESSTDTARPPSLHRNTVRYRVSKALEQADIGNRSSRMDLAVALNVCHFLGPSTLRDPAAR